MSEQVLVTGGAGFIGSHLVDALIQAGYKVRVYDSLEPQVHGNLRDLGEWPDYTNRNAEYILGYVRDRSKLQKAVQHADVIFHLAAVVGVGQSMYKIEHYVDANVRGTAVLLDILANEAPLRTQVRRLVVASSMSIYGEGKYMCPTHGAVYPGPRPDAQLASADWENRCRLPKAGGNGTGCGELLVPAPTDEDKPLLPTSIYALTKRDQEEMCMVFAGAYGVPTVAMRYFNVYGRRQALSNPYTGVAAIFSSRLLNGMSPVIFEDGSQTRDFVHVSDVVQANLLAMESDDAINRVFNLGTGNPSTILEVARTLSRHLNGKTEPEIVNKFRSGDIRHCIADISRLEELGYEPQVTFENGIPELVEWVRQQVALDGFEEAHEELVIHGLA